MTNTQTMNSRCAGAVLAMAIEAFGGTPPPQPCDPGETPDILVANINSVARFGNVGGITAYSFGLQFCNQGTCWLNFLHNTNQHPVVGHNLYRLNDGRFEQIGMSWLQHGFFALSQNTCFSDCQPTDGTHLGVHCADVSSASSQGQQSNLGPRSQVNPADGSFPFPFSAPPAAPTIGRRLQVHDADLDPALNAGALYFAASQFITPDDALAGNGNNNASYRPVTVGPAPSFFIALMGTTVREQAAIHAWKANGFGAGVSDPAVEERDIQVAGDGLFILAAKATEVGGGFWRYEYAIQNMNSHRAARSFTVPLPPGVAVQNAAFRDVDYHSGEPYDLTDWTANVTADSITWSTDPFELNENANALRWGTLYNFRFDADAPPGDGQATLGLFRPASPDSVMADSVVPRVGAPAAIVTAAVSRQLNPAGPSGNCDVSLFPVRTSEPSAAGISEVRIGFNVAPGVPGGSGISLEEAKCGAPGFAPYAGGSVATGNVSGNELILAFFPPLENARTYRMTLSASITAISGQSVEVRALIGDVNGDGFVDGTDRSVLMGVWTGGGFTCTTDVNGDGFTNATDRSTLVGFWTGTQTCAPEEAPAVQNPTVCRQFSLGGRQLRG